MPTQILIVDDHEIVRQGVRSLLSTSRPEWKISEAADGAQAFQWVQNSEPDLIVMDVSMPGLSGLKVSSGLRKSGYGRPILMFTMHQSARLSNEAREAGAQGYVLKSQAVEDLVRAIDILLAGGTFFGAPPARTVVPGNPGSGLTFFMGLTPRYL